MIARIAVSAATFAIDKPYSYFVPPSMHLQPGVRVMVPFSRSNRRVEGVVLEVGEGREENLKPVEQVLDEEPVLSPTMLQLAAFLRGRCFCTYFDVVRAMLPGGLWFEAKDSYTLTPDRSWEEKPPRQPDALKILEALRENGGTASGTKLSGLMEEDAFEKAAAYLLRKKWITAQRSLSRKTRDKTEKIAVLGVEVSAALAFAASRSKAAAMQRRVIELLCSVGSASVKDICYYTGCGTQTVNRLTALGLIQLQERQVLRCREITPAKIHGSVVLNPEQEEVFEGLCSQLSRKDPGGALLHGVTGSGKTSVYIRLIERCLSQGKQAILLVPEIALTPQLLGLMAAHFGQKVAVLHSSLSVGERYDQWKRTAKGKAQVVVGTRSAVFAPCPNLGLIILDEEQEHSYQSETNPRYAAKEVALWRGLKEGALVLFGSATPSIETMYQAKTGKLTLYTLKNRYNGKALPRVEIVDMRQELKLGNPLSLSLPLQEGIRKRAEAGEQTILFLNRRGNSRALVCVDCRRAPECPRCSARLTYHSANGRLMCHYCGYSQPAPSRCPTCGGPMKALGTGTQKVQQELEALNPEYPVIRMDADTVSAVNTHEKILERFEKENIPVLVGTQMVAKGLNLPRVTLVGVLDGDLSLYNNSFRAGETTFNMLTQVVGRAGRGDLPGEAIIQTLVPEHKIITLAARQDYEGFYQLELELRRVQHCPPFGDVVQLTFSGEQEPQVIAGAVKFRDSLLSCLSGPEYRQEACRVLGPAPCPVVKVNYHYRHRLTVNCRMTQPLRLLLAHLLRQFFQDRQNKGVSAFVDVNGYE